MKTYLVWAILLVVLATVPLPNEVPKRLVGSKIFTESVILGDMLQQLAEDADVPMGHLRELGGTQVVYQSLKNGEIVGYVEYTGTIDEEIFAGQKISNAAERAEQLATDGILMSSPLGFNNTYGLAMRADRAEALKVSRISDLGRIPDLVFGFANEFMDRADGWPGLKQHYRLPHEKAVGLHHDLAYRQIEAGEIDVMDAYTTDAKIEPYELTLLEDDLEYFPTYEAVILYSQSIADERPELILAWSQLAGALDEEQMSQLNARVDLESESESFAAATFLQEKFNIESEMKEETALTRICHTTVEHLDLVRRSLIPAILVAIPLGILASKSAWLGQTVLGIAGMIQTIPALALLVLLMPVAHGLGLSSVGPGSATAIICLFLYSLLPVIRNTVAGLHNIPSAYQDSASALGLSSFWKLNYVELPLATRTILAGIKTAAVLNIGYATLGALIGAGGFGQPILTGIRLNRFSLILEGAVPAAVLALLVQGAFELLERYAIPRGLRVRKSA